jgi:hypothetical protein
MAKIRHRIPTDLSQCERVLEKLSSSEIVSFFLAYERNYPEYPDAFFQANPGFPSLNDVAAKLQQGGYGRPDEFYWEVWGIFKAFTDFHKDRETRLATLFWSLAEEGLMRFMRFCKKEAMTDTERHLRELKRLQKDTAKVHMHPLFSDVSYAYDAASGASFDTYEVPGKVDPIMYYEI